MWKIFGFPIILSALCEDAGFTSFALSLVEFSSPTHKKVNQIRWNNQRKFIFNRNKYRRNSKNINILYNLNILHRARHEGFKFVYNISKKAGLRF